VSRGRVRIGTSGWSYADWREAFYPKGLPQSRWLEHYATVFDTVEINATFYRLPTASAVARWARQTPAGFVFAVKGSRYLTHVKRLTDTARGVERFFERLSPLIDEGKLGPVLWQLPETFSRDDERLASFADALPAGRHCFEFRHPSWFAGDVLALLAERDFALVIGDDPRRTFQLRELTTGWTYLRFHRGSGRDGHYATEQLRDWSGWIRDTRSQAEVYAYFNDDWQAWAPRDARALRQLVEDVPGSRRAA
jgi:uncharacterized protein YecE (DUF72 family)